MRQTSYVKALGADDAEDVGEQMRRHEVPRNEIPVPLPVVLVLARTDDVVVFVSAGRIFSTGVSFQLTTQTRTPSDALHNHWRPRESAGGGLFFGVELSDGRRASTVAEHWTDRDHHRDTDDVTLIPRGGGGDSTHLDQDYFLSPVPAEGSMTFYVVWPELGIAQSSVTISTSGWAEDADQIAQLWPLRSPDLTERPTPPAPPPGTWFDQSQGTDSP